MLDKLKERGFEIQFQSYAAAILERDFPEALADIEKALLTFEVPIAEIIGSGGGETKGMICGLDSERRVSHPFTHRFSSRLELWRAPSLRFVREPALSGAEGAGAMPPKAGGWFVVTHPELFAKGK